MGPALRENIGAIELGDILEELTYETLNVAEIVAAYRDLKRSNPGIREREEFGRFASKFYQEKIDSLTSAAQDLSTKISEEDQLSLNDLVEQIKQVEKFKFQAFNMLHQSVEKRLKENAQEFCARNGFTSCSIDENGAFFNDGSSIESESQQELVAKASIDYTDNIREVFYQIVSMKLPEIWQKANRESLDDITDLDNAKFKPFVIEALKSLDKAVEIGGKIFDDRRIQTVEQREQAIAEKIEQHYGAQPTTNQVISFNARQVTQQQSQRSGNGGCAIL